MRESIQMEFCNGKIVKREEAEIQQKDIPLICSILGVAEIGDTVATIRGKLDAWIKRKNSVKDTLAKLEILGIIRAQAAAGGRKIIWVSEDAVAIAEQFLWRYEHFWHLLNDLKN